MPSMMLINMKLTASGKDTRSSKPLLNSETSLLYNKNVTMKQILLPPIVWKDSEMEHSGLLHLLAYKHLHTQI